LLTPLDRVRRGVETGDVLGGVEVVVQRVEIPSLLVHETRQQPR